jgi:ABC-type multidrug transport system permease subunit
VHALKNLLLKNTGIAGIYSDLLVLSGFAVAFIVASIALFKRQI